MECYDASTHVYYPHHSEYVGPDPKMQGRCCRCLEITDHQLAAAGAAAVKRGDAEAEAYRCRPRHWTAEWNGEQYVVRANDWYSYDGDEWITGSGEPVIGDEFESSTIALSGGPRHGTTVG